MKAAPSPRADHVLAGEHVPHGPTAVSAAFQTAREGFDHAAASYDEDFTDSLIGRLQREAVWRRLDRLFSPGDHVLDLGCGTAADAIHLAQRGLRVHAMDVSAQMIAAANRKIAAAGLTASVTTAVGAIEELDPARLYEQTGLSASPASAKQSWPSGTSADASIRPLFDGAISNFGALNCVAGLRPVALALSRLVHPGGHVAICVISRFCLWETVFYGLQGRFSKAARRWRFGNAVGARHVAPAKAARGALRASVNGSAQFPIYYRSAAEIVEAFRPEFRLQHHSAIGLFVPPSYVEPSVRRWSSPVRCCAGLDRVFSGWPLLRSAADHAFFVLTREPQP